jgi:aminomethyltransferase
MVVEQGGRPVGRVTSGAFSPSLERSVAMGYVESALAGTGTALEVAAGTARIPVRVVQRPFYGRGSRR